MNGVVLVRVLPKQASGRCRDLPFLVDFSIDKASEMLRKPA